MENMKYTMSYIAKNFRVALMLSLMMLLCSCSSEDKLELHKGATLPIMQGIADNVP